MKWCSLQQRASSAAVMKWMVSDPPLDAPTNSTVKGDRRKEAVIKERILETYE